MPHPSQLQFLTIVVPLVLMVTGIYRPTLAVIGYLVLVYCKTSELYPIIATIRGELVFAILILIRLFFTEKFFLKLSVTSDNINRYMLWLVISVFISFVFAWDHQMSWDNAVYHFIKTFLVYLMIVGAIDSPSDLKLFVFSFVCMFSYLAYEPAYGFLTGTGGSQFGYGTNYQSSIGILAGHVALANNMNQMIPLAWFLGLSIKNKLGKVFIWVAILIFIVALVGSGSRGGVVGIVVAGISIVYFSRQRLRAGIIIGIIVLMIAATLGSSILNTTQRINSDATRGRLIGLTHGVGMLQRGNILGVGPGCYPIARRAYFGWRMDAHNIYGEIIGDLGLPGIIVTFLLLREIFRRINKIKGNLVGINKGDDFIYYLLLGVQVSLITRLVISMASHGLYYFYWYTMAAIVVAASQLVENGRSVSEEVKQINGSNA